MKVIIREIMKEYDGMMYMVDVPDYLRNDIERQQWVKTNQEMILDCAAEQLPGYTVEGARIAYITSVASDRDNDDYNYVKLKEGAA